MLIIKLVQKNMQCYTFCKLQVKLNYMSTCMRSFANIEL